jgi:hypothetical protein
VGFCLRRFLLCVFLLTVVFLSIRAHRSFSSGDWIFLAPFLAFRNMIFFDFADGSSFLGFLEVREVGIETVVGVERKDRVVFFVAGGSEVEVETQGAEHRVIVVGKEI